MTNGRRCRAGIGVRCLFSRIVPPMARAPYLPLGVALLRLRRYPNRPARPSGRKPAFEGARRRDYRTRLSDNALLGVRSRNGLAIAAPERILFVSRGSLLVLLGFVWVVQRLLDGCARCRVPRGSWRRSRVARRASREGSPGGLPNLIVAAPADRAVKASPAGGLRPALTALVGAIHRGGVQK